nr:hypothetical protein [Tanacetum cinerariifolium]
WCGDGIDGSSTGLGTSSSVALTTPSTITPAVGTPSSCTSSTCCSTIIPSKSGVLTPENPLPTLLMFANTFWVRAGDEYLVVLDARSPTCFLIINCRKRGDARISMDLLQNLLDTYITLTRIVENLEHDKVAQALEITKLKQRVKKLERKNKASKLKRLRVGTTQRIETSNDTFMDDVSKQGRMISDMDAVDDVILEDANKEVAVEKSTDVDESPDIQGRKAESQAQIYQIDLEQNNKVLSIATITAAAPQLTTVAAPILTTAPSAARRRKE